MEWLPYFLLLGSVAGLFAGIFGVGGGAIVVPLLMIAFVSMELDPARLAHLAVGTSFATIVFTSAGSIWGHHSKSNIDWQLWWRMAPMLAIGVSVGGYVASKIPSIYLLPLIGLFFAFVALQLFFGFAPNPVTSKPVTGLAARLAGFFIGGISAFFGIGGGTLSVPWLRHHNYSIHRAVGTAAACGMPIALFGALSYGYFGLGVSSTVIVPGSLGFIYLPAFVGVVLASVPMAMLGAKLAARMPAVLLNRLFAFLLFGIGLYVLITSLLELTA